MQSMRATGRIEFIARSPRGRFATPRARRTGTQTIAPGVILEDGDLKITAYVAEHPPIHPAVGYRFDYRGRSVVISGDSNVNGDTLE